MKMKISVFRSEISQAGLIIAESDNHTFVFGTDGYIFLSESPTLASARKAAREERKAHWDTRLIRGVTCPTAGEDSIVMSFVSRGRQQDAISKQFRRLTIAEDGTPHVQSQVASKAPACVTFTKQSKAN